MARASDAQSFVGKTKGGKKKKAGLAQEIMEKGMEAPHGPSAAPRMILPKRGDGGIAKRTAMQEILGTLKEDPRTVIPNDFHERSFPTGYIVLDEVLGVREIPFHGRIAQVHGDEHTGKSTILYCMAAAQQAVFGNPVVIWDIEGQLSTDYLWQCGLDPDPSMTLIRQSRNPNEILRITTNMMNAGACDYFIFDSVSHILPVTTQKEIDQGKALDSRPGEQAKIFKKFLYTLMPYALYSDSAMHFVNQQSCLIPQTQKEQMAMKYATITNWNHTITGGKAARFAPSLMYATAKGKAFDKVGEDEEWLFAPNNAGIARSWNVNRTEVRVVKNKVNGGGYREYHLYIRPAGGIDDWISVRELAKNYNLIQKVPGGYIAGKAECPLASWKTKAEAVKALVIEQNMDILIPLRALTVDCIRQDDPLAFGYERSDLDRYMADEIHHLPGSTLDLEEDTLGEDDALGEDDTQVGDTVQ